MRNSFVPVPMYIARVQPVRATRSEGASSSIAGVNGHKDSADYAAGVPRKDIDGWGGAMYSANVLRRRTAGAPSKSSSMEHVHCATIGIADAPRRSAPCVLNKECK